MCLLAIFAGSHGQRADVHSPPRPQDLRRANAATRFESSGSFDEALAEIVRQQR